MEVNENCAGGIVIGDGGTIALVHNPRSGVWGFPKGKIEVGEEDEPAARREIEEETGLKDLEYIDDLGTYEREGRMRPGTPLVRKHIHLYLFAAAPHSELAPSMEIEEAKWVPVREVASTLTIDKDRAFFATVFERVREAIQRD